MFHSAFKKDILKRLCCLQTWKAWYKLFSSSGLKNFAYVSITKHPFEGHENERLISFSYTIWFMTISDNFVWGISSKIQISKSQVNYERNWRNLPRCERKFWSFDVVRKFFFISLCTYTYTHTHTHIYIYIYDQSVDSSCFALWELINTAQIKIRFCRTRALKLLLELWELHCACGYPSRSTECASS